MSLMWSSPHFLIRLATRALGRVCPLVSCICIFTMALNCWTRESSAAFLPLEDIPTEGHVYEWIDDLATRYGTLAPFLQTRPWQRKQVESFLDSLVARNCSCTEDPAFVRLKREVNPAAEGGTRPALRFGDSLALVEASPYAIAHKKALNQSALRANSPNTRTRPHGHRGRV